MHPLHEVKFSAFLLASAEFHTVLRELWDEQANDEDGAFNVDEIIDSFERLLAYFFSKWREPNARAAAEFLANEIPRLSPLTTASERPVSTILSKCGGAILRKIASWDYNLHLADLHDAARRVARDFFTGCQPLRRALGKECTVGFHCQESRLDRPFMQYAPSMRHIEAHFSFAPAIVAHETSFCWYLALPFRFLHEYTAHVYPLFVRCEHFSDGWMIAAAFRYIAERSLLEPDEFAFSIDQVYVFERRLCGTLGRIPQNGIDLAQWFFRLLEAADRRNLFIPVTRALCSLCPAESERRRTELIQNFIRNLRTKSRDTRGVAAVRRLATLGVDSLVAEMTAA
jgi:hypothetical protein